MAQLLFNGSIWCNLDVVVRQIERSYRQETEPFDLTVVEGYILRALYEHDGQIPSRLAETLGGAPTSFTPILDSMVSKGFIESGRHFTDRRAVRIYLTEKLGRSKNRSKRVPSALRRYCGIYL